MVPLAHAPAPPSSCPRRAASPRGSRLPDGGGGKTAENRGRSLQVEGFVGVHRQDVALHEAVAHQRFVAELGMVEEGAHAEREDLVLVGQSSATAGARPELHYLLTASADEAGRRARDLALGMRAFLDHPKLSNESAGGRQLHEGRRPAGARRRSLRLADFVHDFRRFFRRPPSGSRLPRGDAALLGKELGRSRRVRRAHIDVFDQLRPPPGSVSAKELGVEAKPPKIVATKK